MMPPTILGACNAEGKTSPKTNDSPNVNTNDSSRANTNQILENDVLVRLSTNNSTYFPGETVSVIASVENRSSNAVEYILSSLGDPTPYVYLEGNQFFPYRRALEEKSLGGGRTVQPLITSGQLKPHEVVIREVVWDQKYGGQQAPQGTYRIGSAITLGVYRDSSSWKVLSVNLDVHIVGGPQWITPEQAKAIALDLAEVKAWFATHSGKNLVREENGDYYILLDDWQKISLQFTYSESSKTMNLDELREWIPEADVRLEDSKWTIRTGTKLGTNPHFLKIQIEPVKGSVLNVQFSDRTPF